VWMYEVVNGLLQYADEEESAAHDHLSHGQHPAYSFHNFYSRYQCYAELKSGSLLYKVPVPIYFSENSFLPLSKIYNSLVVNMKSKI
jgi:hypothetical protein